MGNASKGSANPFFKSKYADLNSIREACMPALATNGLMLLQPTVVIDGKSYIETLIIHDSGEYIGGHTEIVYAKQNDAQNFGAGTTYARRFGLQSLLCIGAEDSDGEEAVGRGRGATKQVSTPATKEVHLTKEATKEITEFMNREIAAPAKKTGFGVKAPVVETEPEGWA
jgi:hypothetical protein